MGWSSATLIFDDIIKTLLEANLDKKALHKVAITLASVFEDADWDTYQDSMYFYHPAIAPAMKELHPNLFSDGVE